MQEHKGKNNTPSTEPTVTAVQAIPAETPAKTLACRFAAQKPSTNAKAPIARCLVTLSERPDGLLRGLVLDVPIFKAKDGNGISVMIPGGSFPAVKPKNIIVTNGAGVEFETTTPDPDGASVANQLDTLIRHAYGVWIVSGKAEQSLTFA